MQPYKIIQDFRPIIIDNIFCSNTFRERIYFPAGKNSYLPVVFQGISP